jgi:hypothetical protein
MYPLKAHYAPGMFYQAFLLLVNFYFTERYLSHTPEHIFSSVAFIAISTAIVIFLWK